MTGQSKKSAFLGLAAVVILGSLALYWVFHERPLAVIGDTKIYKKDAEYRDEVVRIYFPEEKRNMGLYQLIKSARNVEILRNHGREFSDAALKAEYQRMLTESKDPKMLERIRQVFGEDEKSFYKNFVLPNMADHHIYYEFFLMDPQIQGDSFKRAGDFIKSMSGNNTSQFRELATEQNVKVSSLKLSLKKGMQWDYQNLQEDAAAEHLKRRAQRSRKNPHDRHQKHSAPVDHKAAEYINSNTIKDAQVWYDKIIKNIKPGEVFFEPVSVGEAFIAIHYLKKTSDDEHQLEAAFFQKQDYSAWYKKEQANIKTKIFDESLIPKGLL